MRCGCGECTTVIDMWVVHVVQVLCLTQLTLWMSVVRGMRGVGGVCVARGGVGEEGGEWMRGLCLGFTNPVRTRGMFDVCFGCGGVGRGIVPGSGGVVLCLCALLVLILCGNGRSRYLCIVLGGYRRI